MNRKLSFSFMSGALALTLGCGTDAGLVGPDGEPITNGISFAFATGTGGSGGGGAAPETFTDGVNTLVINKIEVVLGELELERTDFVDCATNPDATTCGDFKVGPLVIDVPVGDIAREFTLEVDSGTYNFVEIEVHKLSSTNPNDSAALADHPDLDGQSIRIEGTYNDSAFVFMTDLNAFAGYEIDPPITIDTANPSTNVTIAIDLDAIFRDQTGTLVDPAAANEGGEFEDLVEGNLINAIDCFEDADEDGQAT